MSAPVVPRPLGRAWPLSRRDLGRLIGWFAGMVAVYVVLGEAIQASGPVGEIDRDVADAFVASRTAALNDLAPWAAALSDTIVKIAATAVIAAVMLKVYRRWLEPLVVVVALVLEASVFMAVTTIVSRSRPAVVRLQESPVDSSFPSGHVAAAAAYAAIALVVAWHVRCRSLRALVWAVPVLVTGAVGWARLYQGMHYLTDVLLGAVLGIWSVAVAAIVVTRAHRRTTVARPGTDVAADGVEPPARSGSDVATTVP